MLKQEHRKLVFRKGDRRKLSASGHTISGLRLRDLVTAFRYVVHGVVQTVFKLWDLNPVSLLLRRRSQTRNTVDTRIPLASKPRLWDLFTNMFLSNEGRKRKLLSWVHSVLPGHKDDVIDFGSSWQDGLVLCALMESLRPGSCPQYKLLKPHHRVNNCRMGLQLAVAYLDNCQAPLSPEEMSLAETETEVKLVHLIQMVMWRYLKQGKKVKVEAMSRDHDQLPCRCQARGTGIKAGIVGRRTKFNIFADIVVDLDLHIEIKGPNNEYNKENIISMTTGDTSKYRNLVMNNAEDDGKAKLISDGAGHTFLRQKSLDEDFSHLIIPFDYQCVGEGRFLVTYIPRSAGLHYITVLSKGRHIQGSPFEVKVSDWVSTWNVVPKARVVPFDMLNTIEETPKEDAKFQSPAIHKLRRKLSHVAIMSKQINMMKRRILKKVITQGGEEIICDVTPSPSLSGHSTPDLGKADDSQAVNKNPLKKDRSYKGSNCDKDLHKPNSNTNSDSNKTSPTVKNTKLHHSSTARDKSSPIISRNLESLFTTRKPAGVLPLRGLDQFKSYEGVSRSLEQRQKRRLQALTTDDLPASSHTFCSGNGRQEGDPGSQERHSKVRKTKSYDFPTAISQHGVLDDSNFHHSRLPTIAALERKHVTENGKEMSDTANDVTDGITATERRHKTDETSNDTQITPELLAFAKMNPNSSESRETLEDHQKSVGFTSDDSLKTSVMPPESDSAFDADHNIFCSKQSQQSGLNDEKQSSQHDAMINDTSLSFRSKSPKSDMRVSSMIGDNLKSDQTKGSAITCDREQQIHTMPGECTQDKKVNAQCSQCGISLPSNCACSTDSGNESTKDESDEDLNPSTTVCVECCNIHPDHFHNPDTLSQFPCYCSTKLADNMSSSDFKHSQNEISSSDFKHSQNEIMDCTENSSWSMSHATGLSPSFSFREGPGGFCGKSDVIDFTHSDSYAGHCLNKSEVSCETETNNKRESLDSGMHSTRNTVNVLQNTNVSRSNLYFQGIKLKRSRSLDDVTLSANEDDQESHSKSKADFYGNDVLRRRSRLASLKKAWHTFDHDSQTCLSSEKENSTDSNTQNHVTRQDSDRKISLICHGETGDEILQVVIENAAESDGKIQSANRCEEAAFKSDKMLFGEEECLREEEEEEQGGEEDSLVPVSPSSVISDATMESMKSSPVLCTCASCNEYPCCNDTVVFSTSMLTPNPSPSSFGTNKSGNSDWSDTEDTPSSRTTLMVFEPPDCTKDRWSPHFVDYHPIPKYSHRRSASATFLPVVSSPENPIRVPSYPVTSSEFIVHRESWLEESSNPTEDSSLSGSLSGGEANLRDTSAAGQNEICDETNIANVAMTEAFLFNAASVGDSRCEDICDGSMLSGVNEASQACVSIKTGFTKYSETVESAGGVESFHYQVKPRYKAVTVISHEGKPTNFCGEDNRNSEQIDDALQNTSKTRLIMRVPSIYSTDSENSHVNDDHEFDDNMLDTSNESFCSLATACAACERTHFQTLASLGGGNGNSKNHSNNTNPFQSSNSTNRFDSAPNHRGMSPFERLLTPTKFRHCQDPVAVNPGGCSCQCACSEWRGSPSSIDILSQEAESYNLTCSCDSLSEAPRARLSNKTQSECNQGHERSLTPTKYRNSMKHSDGSFRKGTMPTTCESPVSGTEANETTISIGKHYQTDGLQKISFTQGNNSCSSNTKTQNYYINRNSHCSGKLHVPKSDSASKNVQNGRQCSRSPQNRDNVCLHCYHSALMSTAHNCQVPVCTCHVTYQNHGYALRKCDMCAFRGFPLSKCCCHPCSFSSLVSESAAHNDRMSNSKRFLKRRQPMYHTLNTQRDPSVLYESSSASPKMDCKETSDEEMMMRRVFHRSGTVSFVGPVSCSQSLDAPIPSSHDENLIRRTTFDKYNEGECEMPEIPPVQISNRSPQKSDYREQETTKLNESKKNETMQLLAASPQETLTRKEVFQKSNAQQGKLQAFRKGKKRNDSNRVSGDRLYQDQIKAKQTGQSDYSSDRQVGQLEYNDVRKTSQSEYDHVRKTGQSEYKDISKTSQYEYNDLRKTSPSEYNEVRNTSQPQYNDTSKTSQLEHSKISQSEYKDIRKASQSEHTDIRKTNQSEHKNFGKTNQSEHKDFGKTFHTDHNDRQISLSQDNIEIEVPRPDVLDCINRLASGIDTKKEGNESEQGFNPTRYPHVPDSSPRIYRKMEPAEHARNKTTAVLPKGRRAVICNFSGSLSTTDTLDSGIDNV